MTGWLTTYAVHLAGSFGIDVFFELALLLIAIVSWRLVAVARRQSAKVPALMAGTWAVLSTAGCLTVIPAQSWLQERAHQRGDAIAEALERFRQMEGHYPTSLEELVPRDLPAVPRPGQRIFDADGFDYRLDDKDGYALGHTGTAFTWCTRTGSRREWYCVD